MNEDVKCHQLWAPHVAVTATSAKLRMAGVYVTNISHELNHSVTAFVYTFD